MIQQFDGQLQPLNGGGDLADQLIRIKDVDLTSATLFMGTVDDDDLLIIDDGATGNQSTTKKITASTLKTYMGGGASTLNGLSDVGYTGGVLTPSGLVSIQAGADFALDISQELELNSDTGSIVFKDGATTLGSFASGAFSVTGSTTVDKNSTETNNSTTAGLTIDYDHTGIAASGQTVNNIGLDLDLNSDSPTMVGTVVNTGLDIDVVGGTSGTQSNIGIDLDVDGADANIGILINTAGTHLKLAANADAVNDYATIAVQNTGDLTIRNFGDGATDSDIHIKADGDITLAAAGGQISYTDTSATFDFLSLDNANKRIKIYNNANDYAEMLVGTHGDLTIHTVDASLAQAHITLQSDGATVLDAGTSVVLDSGVGYFVAKNDGTEFSATNSAYAGMVLGYTRLNGDGSSLSTFEIQNTMTVEDSSHQISFKTPPSENVEIELQCYINVGSTDTKIQVGLSDNSSYNSIGALFEYDNGGVWFGDDEVDDITLTIKWVLGASELASVGSSNTFYVGFATGGSSKLAYITYGTRATHGVASPPFILKATALPASIYDGT